MVIKTKGKANKASAGLQEREDPAITQFRRDLEAGEPWLDAILLAMGAWTASEEVFQGRRFRYLLQGEAFDWLLLAERLLLSANDLVPQGESLDLLLHGRTPRPLSDAEFRALLGETKYRAAMNFWYGVRVEEGLLLAVQHEIRKSRRGMKSEDSGLEDATYRQIYGLPRLELLSLFFAERQVPAPEGLTLDQLHEFTYWLFKQRKLSSDKARLASDTKKGLLFLNRQGVDRSFHG